jgi:hypothetical protein
MVPTTGERWSGSFTNGVAHDVRSAQPYRRAAESAVRAVAHASPPCSSSQSTCSAIITSVASAGVL